MTATAGDRRCEPQATSGHTRARRRGWGPAGKEWA
jgi:hypothetical protein